MNRSFGPWVLAGTVALVGGLRAEAQAPAKKPARPSEINKPFENPDVDAFVKRFESESREVYSQRDAIVAAVGLRPGMAVADVGAGTGLFTRLFAEKVGPDGRVYAVDISEAFLKHIAAEAKKRNHSHVRTIRGTQESTSLPPGSVDLVFLADVYHHFEQPAKVLASIHQALRPGGRLVVLDFDRTPESSEFIRNHIRAPKETFFREIERAGFEPVPVPNAPRLKENFFAEFRKREKPPGADSPR
jgi:ubiquinone/menaquinone biosynthesis C-methylase UbiE